MNWDQCRLTSEQINALVEGRNTTIEWTTAEEYGRIEEHQIELVPPTVQDVSK